LIELALPAVTVPPFGWKAGRSLASASDRRIAARSFVGLDQQRVALLLLDLDREDLGIERTGLLGGDARRWLSTA
jgi:hypothetical protein